MLPPFKAGLVNQSPAFCLFEGLSTEKVGDADRIYTCRKLAERIHQGLGIDNLKTMADAALVARMGKEPDALACIYDRYGALVYGIALRVTRDSMAAEDIVNDVFMQLWINPTAFKESRGKLPSWLAVITRNRAIDSLRRRRPELDVAVEDVPLANVSSAHSEYFSADFEKAQSIMKALPSDQRKVLELAYFQGLTQSEIASKLGEPLGTVKSRIRLGLTTLKKALA